MAGRKADIPMARKRELSEAVKNSTTGFTEFSRGAYKAVKFGPNPVAKAAAKEIARGKMAQPAAGSVEMVKKTAKQFGQKVSGKEANNISRLLRGRGR